MFSLLAALVSKQFNESSAVGRKDEVSVLTNSRTEYVMHYCDCRPSVHEFRVHRRTRTYILCLMNPLVSFVGRLSHWIDILRRIKYVVSD